MTEKDEFDGFRLLQVKIYKTQFGDGSVRFCEEYSSGSQEVGGVELSTLQELEARVRPYVALDWAIIAEHLEGNDNWSTTVSIHDEAAAELFG